jgi:hypothetical protein
MKLFRLKLRELSNNSEPKEYRLIMEAEGTLEEIREIQEKVIRETQL